MGSMGDTGPMDREPFHFGESPFGDKIAEFESDDPFKAGIFEPDKTVFGGEVRLDDEFHRMQAISDQQLEAELSRLVEVLGPSYGNVALSVRDGVLRMQLAPRQTENLRQVLADLDTERVRGWFDSRLREPTVMKIEIVADPDVSELEANEDEESPSP